jgi:hypothetical protein
MLLYCHIALVLFWIYWRIHCLWFFSVPAYFLFSCLLPFLLSLLNVLQYLAECCFPGSCGRHVSFKIWHWWLSYVLSLSILPKLSFAFCIDWKRFLQKDTNICEHMYWKHHSKISTECHFARLCSKYSVIYKCITSGIHFAVSNLNFKLFCTY